MRLTLALILLAVVWLALDDGSPLQTDLAEYWNSVEWRSCISQRIN